MKYQTFTFLFIHSIYLHEYSSLELADNRINQKIWTILYFAFTPTTCAIHRCSKYTGASAQISIFDSYWIICKIPYVNSISSEHFSVAVLTHFVNEVGGKLISAVANEASNFPSEAYHLIFWSTLDQRFRGNFWHCCCFLPFDLDILIDGVFI